MYLNSISCYACSKKHVYALDDVHTIFNEFRQALFISKLSPTIIYLPEIPNQAWEKHYYWFYAQFTNNNTFPNQRMFSWRQQWDCNAILIWNATDITVVLAPSSVNLNIYIFNHDVNAVIKKFYNTKSTIRIVVICEIIRILLNAGIHSDSVIYCMN